MKVARRESWEWLLNRLARHSRVASFVREGSYLVRIHKTNGEQVVLFFCDEYMVGVEALDAAREIAPQLDALVTSSVWNRYSRTAKEEAASDGIGVFRGTEILGALWKDGDEFVQYLSPEQLAAIARGEDPY